MIYISTYDLPKNFEARTLRVFSEGCDTIISLLKKFLDLTHDQFGLIINR
jgi:hypothetical protein